MREHWREGWRQEGASQVERGQRDSRTQGRDRGTAGHRAGWQSQSRAGGVPRERGVLGTWMDGAPRWGGTGDRGTERSVQRGAPARGEEQRGPPEDRAGGCSARVTPTSPPCCGLLPPAQGAALGRVPCCVPTSVSPSACPFPCPPCTPPSSHPRTCAPRASPRHPVPLPHTHPSAGGGTPHACPCVPKHMLSPSPALEPPPPPCRWQEDTEGGWGPAGAAPTGGSAPHGPPGTHRKPHLRPAVWRPTWWDRAGDRGDSQGGGARAGG